MEQHQLRQPLTALLLVLPAGVIARSSLGLGPSLLCVMVFAAVGYLRPDHFLHHLDTQTIRPKQPQPTAQHRAGAPRRRLYEWPLYLAEARATSAPATPAAASGKHLTYQRMPPQTHANNLKDNNTEKIGNTLVN